MVVALVGFLGLAISCGVGIIQLLWFQVLGFLVVLAVYFGYLGGGFCFPVGYLGGWDLVICGYDMVLGVGFAGWVGWVVSDCGFVWILWWFMVGLPGFGGFGVSQVRFLVVDSDISVLVCR